MPVGRADHLRRSRIGRRPFEVHGSALTPDSTFSGAKSDSGYSPRRPLAARSHRLEAVNVMIKYDFDATASYTGGVKGLAATSPRVTGKSLKANGAAVAAYDTYTANGPSKITARVEQAVPTLKVGTSFRTAYGGVAAQVPANQIGALLKVPGVVGGAEGHADQPHDDNTSFIGATTVWPSLGGSPNAGSQRHRRRHRHRHLARASDARRRAASAPRPAASRPASSVTAPTPPTSARRSPATTSSSAPTRRPPRTWRNIGAGRATSSATTRRSSARRATPRATARTRRRPPPATASPPPSSTASSAARSAASPPARA